jgi:hypothetical protein
MESLKKIGDVGRQHWEKIILIVALLGLGVAVLFLMGESQTQKEKINEYFETKVRQKVKGVEVVDLTEHQKALETLQNPPELNFSTPHNLFNPVKWQRTPDRRLIKIQSGREIGPYALTVRAIRPLHLTLALDRSTSSGYYMIMTNESAPHPAWFRKTKYVLPGQTNVWQTGYTNVFRFVVMEGRPAEEAKELVVQLPDSAQEVTFTDENPYQAVQGYECDLRYDPDNKDFKDIKVGDQIRLSGEAYNIVAINPAEVILSANSNDRRYAVNK